MDASFPTGRQSLPSRRSRACGSSSQPPRVHVAYALLLILACLTSAVLARPDVRRASITPPASLAATTSSAVPEIQSTVAEEGWEAVARTEELKLRKRKGEEQEDEDDDQASTTETDKSTSKHHSTTTTKKPSAATTVLTISLTKDTAQATSTSAPLPSAYDGNLATDIDVESGSNCPNFLEGVLSDPTFETCYPLSMLLQTSNAFFKAQQQLVSLVKVLDATCAANVTYCTEFFDAAAANLTAEENCKAEWKAGNFLVKEALLGFKAYEMMYKATCLQNPDDDMYCFAEAVTNLTNASDAYFYFLPYNLTLPGSSVPSCNWCNQETMGIFHAASADRSQYISDTYESAARQVNTICGSDFVNGTLPDAETSKGFNHVPSWSIAITIVAATILNLVL